MVWIFWKCVHFYSSQFFPHHTVLRKTRDCHFPLDWICQLRTTHYNVKHLYEWIITLCRLTLAIAVLNYFLKVPGYNIGHKWNVSQYYQVRRSEQLRQRFLQFFFFQIVILHGSWFSTTYGQIYRVPLYKPLINYGTWSSTWLLSLEWSLIWPTRSVLEKRNSSIYLIFQGNRAVLMFLVF